MEWRIYRKKKGLALLLILCMVTTVLAARENEEKSRIEDNNEKSEAQVHFLPLVSYDFLSLESQTIHSPGTGLMIAGENTMAVGLYTFHSLKNASSNVYPTVYHSLEFVLDGEKNRHAYLAVFKSESDKPVYGGLNTFQGAAVYGYHLFDGPRLSLVLGAGLGVGDFGIETANGTPWPLLPVPLIRFNYTTEWVETSFEFLTGPNLTFTIAPEKRIRFTGDFRMDQFKDIHDLIFESALHYRFFSADHPMGDLAGVSIGLKNEVYEFQVAGEEEPQEIQYYALFGTIDLTLLKISGGYAFSEGSEKSGFFLSLQGMYRF
ncbi:MAG: hypothetical protein K9L66_06520 [Spirochaetaceae bacterium]|nr:hypothetical protein [Spirochaetaceae bacterium]MCF7938907.1 hypothetical protein [Spirochaetales bacterium]